MNEQCFPQWMIEKVTKKPPLHIRFLLHFCKPIYGIDTEEWTCYVEAKKLFGKTYIQEIGRLKT